MKADQILRVRRLSPNGTIGIFSPSEPIVKSREERFNKGISILEKHGFKFKLGKNSLARSAYTAGSVDDRLEDIYTLASDPEVGALMASWGGKSCNQLIKKFNYQEVSNARKPIMGFSDGDVLLNTITANTGLVTFHGPNVVGKLDETSHSNLSLLVSGEAIENKNLLGETSSKVAETIQGGKVTGRLFGGNLSTFVLSMFYFDLPQNLWDGGIFFWEEASMPPQLIDQYLTGLINAGFLDRIAGMIVGCFIHEDPVDWKRADGLATLRNVLSRYNYPILYCPTFGHMPVENPLLPIGAMCSLDAHAARLTLAEQIFE
jgi:muramoyltetrapeptide carboxypeptidase